VLPASDRRREDRRRRLEVGDLLPRVQELGLGGSTVTARNIGGTGTRCMKTTQETLLSVCGEQKELMSPR
jgi:hypothetical protein